MKTFIIASASALILILLAASIGAHPAFALKNFFACITDISAKDGGDHNLTAQQVLDCFDKEFPNNDHSIHSFHSFNTHSNTHSSIVVDNGHIKSEIINGFNH